MPVTDCGGRAYLSQVMFSTLDFIIMPSKGRLMHGPGPEIEPGTWPVSSDSTRDIYNNRALVLAILDIMF